MSDISKIKVNDKIYDVKDNFVREQLPKLATITYVDELVKTELKKAISDAIQDSY